MFTRLLFCVFEDNTSFVVVRPFTLEVSQVESGLLANKQNIQRPVHLLSDLNREIEGSTASTHCANDRQAGSRAFARL